ncbi:unnamed protein product [Amoebophrya sp. A120]|nr:unnamed protein product [Amoebophrya sp. A120]|eukprot:GSA120T00005711001.1
MRWQDPAPLGRGRSCLRRMGPRGQKYPLARRARSS